VSADTELARAIEAEMRQRDRAEELRNIEWLRQWVFRLWSHP
jgi:hypothetical protein